MSDKTPSAVDSLQSHVSSLREQYSTGRTVDTLVFIGLILFVLVLRPVISSDLILGYESIANTILIWMLFAAAFNLLLGYTGLLSFGHAMFLGWGMYSMGIILSQVSTSLFFLAAIVAIVGASALAYVIGRLIVQKGDIYFAMLTIAFGEVLWYIANTDPGGLTGGNDGIAQGVLPPWIASELGRKFVEFNAVSIDIYWPIGAVFVICIYLLFRIVRSPFGRTLIAIRENEDLAQAIGVNTTRYKVYAFTLSAAFTAVAGVMLEVVNQGVTLSSLHWSTSGEVVMMTVLGGMSSFAGPMVGAFLWEAGASYLTSFTTLHLPLSEFAIVSYDVSDLMEYWRFLFGLLFVLIVLTYPEGGAWGIIKRIVKWTAGRLGITEAEQ